MYKKNAINSKIKGFIRVIIRVAVCMYFERNKKKVLRAIVEDTLNTSLH